MGKMARSMPMPSSKEQRHGREREQSGEHDRQHNHKHACWPRWSLSHQADDYELRQFVKELENSFGCNRRTSSSLSTWSHLLIKARSCRRRERHHASLQARESLHEELRLHVRLDDAPAQA